MKLGRVSFLSALVVMCATALPAQGTGSGEPPVLPPDRDGDRDLRLFANSDAGAASLKSVGFFNRVCIDNTSGIFGRFGCTNPFNQLAPNGFVTTYFRDARLSYGVPKTDWLNAQALVPELANAIGGGWTVTDVVNQNQDDTGPADGGLGLHHLGATSTNDRSCRDNTSVFASGRLLLASSDCPATWGSEGFRGARPIPLELFESRYTANPAAFNFDFWRVPEADILAAGVEENKFLGSVQAYGFSSDYGEDVLCGNASSRNFAHVVPVARQPSSCASANPANRRPGWPLGIEVRIEGFTFQLPAIKDVAFYQLTLTNRSRDLYGVAVNYDSFYVSLTHGMFSNLGQQASIYDWVEKNTRVGSGSTFAVCDPANDITDIRCNRLPNNGAPPAWQYGVTALIVLKSPIGDTRNKLFSTPGSPFFNLAHPLAGDTITFNHSHMCGFRNCGANTWAAPATNSDVEQRVFGMMSSTELNVVGTRNINDVTAFSDNVYYHTFRNHAFPTRYNVDPVNGGFTRYVPPGNWDYNHDGTLDTLHFDSCHLNGCVELFSDTMPNGALNGYSNTNGNMGVGPIRLMADSSVGFVMAITTAIDSVAFLSQVNSAIDHYMNFYLGPEAPPKCRVVGVNRGTAADGSNVSFVWNNACFPGWTDKFMLKQAADLAAAAPGSPLGRLRQLNPRLDDTLNFLATNNLAKLHLFKSCDDGATWTDDDDCDGDPASAGPFAALGFLPRVTYDAAGGLPTSYSDAAILPGRTFTYNVVGETRGAVFTLLNGDSVGVNGAGDSICAKNCRAEIVTIAPVLFNALSPSTGDPNVARVYVPLSRQAGASRSQVALATSAGPMPASRVGITVNADSIPAASYSVKFGTTATATLVETYNASRTLSARSSQVVLVQGATNDTIRGGNLGGFTTSGATAAAPTVAIVGPDSIVTRGFTWGTGPVMALSGLIASADSNPLLVSNTLTGASATPAEFHGHAEYPGFDISANRALSNTFQGQFWLNANASPVTSVTEPTVAWFTGAALQDTTPARNQNQANGEYAITWAARPFGAGEPFTLNFADVPGTQAAILASLNARTQASLGAKTDSAAAAIVASGTAGVTIDSLVAVKLPFTIRNLSYNRDVIVAMRNRPAGRRILIGVGLDTLSVLLPADVWVPGDTLFLIERVSGTGPQAVTFRRAVIGCDPISYTRLSCNPVRALTRGSSIYLGATAGQVQHVTYHQPITPASAFTYQATGPVRGTTLTGQPTAVRSGLAAVRVVPNPFVMLSQYGPNGERGQRMMFTHLPPRGVIRIFTVAGQFVQQISWTETQLGADGDLSWNMRTREGNLVAGGLYLYVLTATDATGGTIGTRTDKFVIIR